MKTILGVIFLSFLLSGNSYAGWFSKLPTLKCTVTPSGEAAFVQFLILENYWTDRGGKFQETKAFDRSYTYVDVKKDSFVVHDWQKEFRGGKPYSGKMVKWMISRKTGGLYLTISPTFFYNSGQSIAITFDVDMSANGLCVEVKK